MSVQLVSESAAMALRRYRHALRFQQLESKLMLAAGIIFEPHQIDLTSSGFILQARSADAADLDGDGDLDVISTSRKEGTIAWHENRDDGAFHRVRNVISNHAVVCGLCTRRRPGWGR